MRSACAAFITHSAPAAPSSAPNCAAAFGETASFSCSSCAMDGVIVNEINAAKDDCSSCAMDGVIVNEINAAKDDCSSCAMDSVIVN